MNPVVWKTAYVALGANLGNPRANVRTAVQALAELDGVRNLHASALYASAPLESNGDDYVNAVVRLETQLPALALLHALQAIEQDAGRLRPYKNAPRTLDLDLLLYGDAVHNTPELTLPHPRMMERAFVLLPLAEIAPELVPPESLDAVRHQGVWWLEAFTAEPGAKETGTKSAA